MNHVPGACSALRIQTLNLAPSVAIAAAAAIADRARRSAGAQRAPAATRERFSRRGSIWSRLIHVLDQLFISGVTGVLLLLVRDTRPGTETPRQSGANMLAVK